MAETKSSTKKDCFSNEYAGANGWKNGKQVAFKLREQREEWKRYVIPVIIGGLSRGIMEAIHKVTKILKQNNLSKKIIEEMQEPY